MSWFYNKQISLMGESGGYMYHGSWVDGTPEVLKTITCDVQPANREEIYKQYGFYIECSQRIFCDIDNALKTGSIVEYAGEKYKIVKIVNWDDYLDIFINNAEVSGNE